MVMASLLAVPASATSEDTNFSFSVSALGYTEMNSNLYARPKDNTTPLYMCYDTGTNSSVSVQAKGCTTKAGSYVNATYANGSRVDYVTCNINTQYLISSLIKESGYSYAKLAFKSNNAVLPEIIGGEWSPDSVGSYQYAT